MCSLEFLNDENILSKVPKLPEGKTKYFFVSSSSEDNDIVFPLIHELEERFKLSCIYADRDFQGGKDITANIREGMSQTLKVLLFLSPNFLQSGWCKYETDAAFITSMGCGYSCIVPVLLQECEIPATLVTLTYIDATIPGTDVSAKIASALCLPDSDDRLLTLNIQMWNKMNENGYCYVIDAQREPVWACRPAKYQFVLDTKLYAKLRENMIEIPYELLEEAMNIANNHSVMWSFDFLNRRKNFLWGFVAIPLLSALSFASVLCVIAGQDSPRDNYLQRNSTYVEFTIMFSVYLCIPLLFVVFQIVLCFVPNVCHRKKRDISLQRKLWQRVGKHCIDNNVIILFTARRNKLPTLHVMRYNIKRCKEHYLGILKSRNLTFTDMSVEEFAEKSLERHLATMTETLADDFDFLPEASYNRHNVKKGKMCICQQLENNL